MLAQHLNDEAAFGLVWLVENTNFAFLDGILSSTKVIHPSLEY